LADPLAAFKLFAVQTVSLLVEAVRDDDKVAIEEAHQTSLEALEAVEAALLMLELLLVSDLSVISHAAQQRLDLRLIVGWQALKVFPSV
jgi:hypothetical protein